MLNHHKMLWSMCTFHRYELFSISQLTKETFKNNFKIKTFEKKNKKCFQNIVYLGLISQN